MIKIFLTVFFGILVGAIVGQKLGGGLWAPVGGIFGGIFAYFTYSFKVVIDGIRLATQKTVPGLGEKICNSARVVGRFVLRWAMFSLGGVFTICLALYVLILPRGIIIRSESSGLPDFSLFTLPLFYIAISLFTSFITSLLVVSRFYSRDGVKVIKDSLEIKHSFFFYNPVLVLFYWLPRLMLRNFARLLLFSIWSSVGFAHVCRTSPVTLMACLVFMGRWGSVFFRYIHSDARVICAVFAFVGAAVGSLASDWTTTVLVALAGGLLGAVEYYVVSVRWLKLQSATAKA